jgi:glycosyltransferase involved in cell wall biosynthesis
MVSLGLLEDAVFIFPNACDVQRIMAESDAARRDGRAAAMRLRYAGTKPLVLFVGRLIPTKDVGTLLTALERLARAGTPVACALAGAGQERSALERQVRQLRLPNVSFLGEVENSALPSLYAAADVVCLPSIEEPWGVVVNEALAAGCPVVCSEAVGAAADMIRPGENGAIFSTRDAEALARSLQDVIQLDRHIALEHARAVARLWDYSRMRAGLYQSISLATGP